METIHLKTIDPASQELLRAAARKGVPLNWERYEKLQPQDGFLRIGLSCPYGCLQGPCRIDPFGRGPDRGLCGLGREGMVAAFLLRLCVQGALESAETERAGAAIFDRDIRGKRLDSPIGVDEIFRSAGMLRRPSESPEQLIRQALRMGILSTRLLENGSTENRSASCEAGYGLLAERKPIIAVSGSPALRVLAKLMESAGREVQIVSLGEWIYCVDRFLPCVCSSGEAELVLSSGRIDFLVFGPGVDPGVLSTCEKMKIPFLFITEAADAEDILNRTRRHYGENGQHSFQAEPLSKESAEVLLSDTALREAFEGIQDEGQKIVFVGGSDSPISPMGHLPVETAAALAGAGYQVCAWGDAALWMIKGGYCSAERLLPVHILNPRTGPLQAAKVLSESKMAARLAGILYTGLKDCRDLSIALGLAASGLPVCVSTPLPVWGSELVRKMLREQIGKGGGSLVHFDHSVQPSELLNGFTS